MTAITQGLADFVASKLENLELNNCKVKDLRYQQIEILYSAREALDQNKNLLIQAPTGCGKTLVYSLVASFLVNRGKRVIIVCPTKDLQRQIGETCGALNTEFIEVYGSGEHICPARSRIFNGKKGQNNGVPVVTLFCKYLKECNYKKRGECNYFKSLDLAKDSPLIITNYNKYLESWDSFTSGEQFDLAIYDEAHNLERIAEDSTRVLISLIEIKKAKAEFLKLFWEDQRIYNLIPILRDTFLLDINYTKEDVFRVIGKFEELIKQFNEYRFVEERNILSSEILHICAKSAENLSNALEIFSFLELCLIAHPENAKITKMREKLVKFHIAATRLRREYEFKGDMKNKEVSDYSTINKEISGNQIIRTMIRYILNRSAKIQFHVSATLGNLYDYAERIGSLDQGFIECQISDYPFDLKRRILLGLIDAPLMRKIKKRIGEKPWEIKKKEANAILEKLILSWPGNTLVFFRSRDEAEETYKFLSENSSIEPRLFFQKFFNTGMERKQIIERFKEKRGSILLGFGRMDQGLDLPGEYLTLIIMYSLPFVIRSDQMQRDFQYYSRKYGSTRAAFEKVDLDMVAKRLSQLVGRLIRSEDDFGAVVVLDKRFYIRFHNWMKGRNMLPHYIDFKFATVDSACKILEEFWGEIKGVPYSEYVETDKTMTTLKDFGLSEEWR